MNLKQKIKTILKTVENNLIQIPSFAENCQYSILVEETDPRRQKMNWSALFNVEICNKKFHINKVDIKDSQIFLEGGCSSNHPVIRKIWKKRKYWNVINIKN